MRNGGELRGNNRDRWARKSRLIERYRADCDLLIVSYADGAVTQLVHDERLAAVPAGVGIVEYRIEPACRCYRCGELLWIETVTCDRIIMGCLGGRYRDENLRPACSRCQSVVGGRVGAARKADRRASQDA